MSTGYIIQQPHVKTDTFQALNNVQPANSINMNMMNVRMDQPIHQQPSQEFSYHVLPPAPQPSHYYTAVAYNWVGAVPSQQPLVPMPRHCQYQPVFQPTGPAMGPVDQPPPTLSSLEYDMDHAADFLSVMMLNLIAPDNVMNPVFDNAQQSAYRNFIYMVLGSTRLTKSTMLLSLCFLSDRVRRGHYMTDSASIYMMTVISFVLANKIHDDNTFTNASWSQATGLRTKDICDSERRWLRSVRWEFKSVGECSSEWLKYEQLMNSSPLPLTPVSSQNSSVSTPKSDIEAADCYPQAMPFYNSVNVVGAYGYQEPFHDMNYNKFIGTQPWELQQLNANMNMGVAHPMSVNMNMNMNLNMNLMAVPVAHGNMGMGHPVHVNQGMPLNAFPYQCYKPTVA